MDETGQEEVRPDSENGSENGFVEVTQEDAQIASQGFKNTSPPVPAVSDDEDLYGAAEGGDDGGEEDGEGAIGSEEEKVREATPCVLGLLICMSWRGPVGVSYHNTAWDGKLVYRCELMVCVNHKSHFSHLPLTAPLPSPLSRVPRKDQSAD